MPNLEIPILCFHMMTPKFKPKNKFESFYFQEVLKHWISGNFISEWNSIFWNFQRTTSGDIPNLFENFFLEVFFPFNFDFEVSWIFCQIVCISEIQRFSTFWKLSWKNSVPYASVSKSAEVLVSWQSRIKKVHLTNKKSGFGSSYPFSQPPLYTMSLVTKLGFIWEHNNIIASLK